MVAELVNEKGMPKIFFDAVKPSPYDAVGASDYSATSLIMSPRQLQLLKRHRTEITEDVYNWWSLFIGNAIHHELEFGLKSNPNYIIERKYTRFDGSDDKDPSTYRRVVAKLDAYDKERKLLSDHKTTTTFIHGKELKPEWIQQLNINAYFLEKEGYPVENVAINAIYKDWRESSGKYKSYSDYPALPIEEYIVKAWPMKEREEFYKERLALHIAEENTPDDKLPPCSSEYTWEKPCSYAVYKIGSDKATKLCSSLAEAKEYMRYKKMSPSMYDIEYRPGECTRCEKFCNVRDFCNQYKALKDKQDSNTAAAIVAPQEV